MTFLSPVKRYPFLLMFFLCLALKSPAQYQLFTWENFENGVFPETLGKHSNANNSNVTILNYSAQNKYPGISEGIARTECGKMGLFFQSNKIERFLTVVSKNILDRKTLGSEGKAIIQADFYIPADFSNMPGLALVAAEINPKSRKRISAFYRLGILNRNTLYFSYLNNETSDSPKIYNPENGYGCESIGRWRPCQAL